MNMLEFDKLKIDKENEEVEYNDEKHTYWTKKGSRECVSVTTLIHKFSTFNEDFWSKYKALETLVNPEDFKYIKSDLLKTKVFNMNILKDLSIDEEVFNNQVDTILEEWRDKRERACARGTKIHKDYELKTLAGDYSALKEYNLPIFSDGGKFSVNTSNKIEEGYYVLPEALLSRVSDDGILRLAGQADLIIVNGNEVIILDYKSNAEIKTKSYYDREKKKSEKMLYPLNHLDDVNYFHYELQLSTYAWMIEKNNPNLKVIGLYLLHHDHNDKKTVYKCEYRKNDVEKMLAYYKKDIEYNDYKKKNELWDWIK